MTKLTSNEDRPRLVCPVCGSDYIEWLTVFLNADGTLPEGEFMCKCRNCGELFNLPGDEPESKKESEAK